MKNFLHKDLFWIILFAFLPLISLQAFLGIDVPASYSFERSARFEGKRFQLKDCSISTEAIKKKKSSIKNFFLNHYKTMIVGVAIASTLCIIFNLNSKLVEQEKYTTELTSSLLGQDNRIRDLENSIKGQATQIEEQAIQIENIKNNLYLNVSQPKYPPPSQPVPFYFPFQNTPSLNYPQYSYPPENNFSGS